MPPGRTAPIDEPLELLQGTLDMLVLRTLLWGRAHGHAIAQAIERTSGDLLRIDHGSLYPALQRLQQEGWIAAEWGVSANNRRAKYYRLTPAGKRHLHAESSRWKRLVRAIRRIMRPAPARS
jgi:PadR family transcriptional regulator PadR